MYIPHLMHPHLLKRHLSKLIILLSFLIIILLTMKNYTKTYEYNKIQLQTLLLKIKNPLSSKILNAKYKPYELSSFSSNDCADSMVTSQIYVTKSSFLPARMPSIIDRVHQKYGGYISHVLNNAEWDELEYEALINSIEDENSISKNNLREDRDTSKWFRFGGSSVWLKDLGVHYVVSRVLYSHRGVKNKPDLSFLDVQIFDREWVDIGGILSGVLNFEFEYTTEGFYFGPEDPRVLIRIREGLEEPVVIFNMKSDKLDMKRAIHAYFPFSGKLVLFQIREQEPLKSEKNWTPFFGYENGDDRYINFIYSVHPLDILKCDLETGACDFIFETSNVKEIVNKTISEMRGGTDLVQIPNFTNLPVPSNRKIWIGFARAHIENCGCGKSMYRPNLIVLVQDYDESTTSYKYKVESIGGYVDFNIDIPGWDIENVGNKNKCDGNSVLIPNSIAYWNVLKVKINDNEYERLNSQLDVAQLENVHFEDYLGLTLSAADTDVRIVHITGILNYILKTKSLFESQENKEYAIDQQGNVQCALNLSKKYCKQYGLFYGEYDIDELDK